MTLSVPLRQTLLPTKLEPPRPITPWVARERLLITLETSGALPITLVTAPAGFGKSTLVAQWLTSNTDGAQLEIAGPDASPAAGGPERSARTCAWLTLDQYDQEPTRFLAYVVAAVKRAAPNSLPQTAALLSGEHPPVHVLIQTLLAELAALAIPLTLVLDDYYTVTSEAIHQLVTYAVRHLPANCHLVLISRMDPPLPLARLRAEGQVGEIRAADLCFTDDEALALVSQLSGVRLDRAMIAALQGQAEGWAIGLQVAALALKDQRERPHKAVVHQSTEYLVDEVFTRQPAAIQQALLALAIPDRFCARLCAALLELPADQPPEALLREIVGSNLFVIPLDDEGCWYRYHHLFREMLRVRLTLSLGPGGQHGLHRRAARWLGEEGLVEEALRHHLAAGDEEHAADLIERTVEQTMVSGFVTASMGRWLQTLPPALVARRPDLLIFNAYLYATDFDPSAAEALLEQVEPLLATPGVKKSTAASADLDSVRASAAYWLGRPDEALTCCRRLETASPPTRYQSPVGTYEGLSLCALGQEREGVAYLAAAAAHDRAAGGKRHWRNWLSAICAAHIRAGDMPAVDIAARELRDTMRDSGLQSPQGAFTDFFLGLSAYEQHDLATAEAHFTALATARHLIQTAGLVSGLVGQGLVFLARGDFDAASGAADEAWAFVQDGANPFVRNQALAFIVRVAMARSDLPAALRAGQQITADHHVGAYIWLETPPLSQARALLLRGESADLARADTLAADCLAQATAMHNRRVRIVALATRALVFQAKRDTTGAYDTLAEAVRLGQQGQFLRTFADLGPTAAPLLRELLTRGVCPDYLGRVLAVCEAQGIPPRASAPRRVVAVPPLLTRREGEILELVAERLSHQEIADRLVIALSTAKTHVATIYSKLGVHNRREAIAAAQALGLLSKR